MPIKYKMIEISQLFSKIKDPTINIEKAVEQYHLALDAYCESMDCKKPASDRPNPPPATIKQFRSIAYGGNGGGPFEFYINSTTINAMKFVLRHGAGIDNLQILLGDGVKKIYTPAQGGSGGGPDEFQVPAGQYITQV